MLKFINLRKLSTKILFGILITGSLVIPTGTKNVLAGQCSNNGNGNNADIIITLSTGRKLTVSKFDPSNPGNGNNLTKAINNATSSLSTSLTSFELSEAQNKLQQLVNDVELNGSSSGGSGCTTGTSTPPVVTPNTITLTGTLRDFKAKNGSVGHPDFERNPSTDTTPQGTKFGYGLDTGIITPTLGQDSKPIYAGGSYSTTTKANFDQWFRDVPGVNVSKSYPITLTKKVGTTNTYSFDNAGQQFFPLDGQLMGNENRTHNYHFTYELNTNFTYKGGETFDFSGDDDVWVFINGKKVIDIGGVHGKTPSSVNLDSLGLTPGKTYELNFFFAERHTSESNFKIETTLELETAPDPNADDDKDTISNNLEGSGTKVDTDKDLTPDYKDDDSDANGIKDMVEVGGIPTSPSDSDNDGTPNFQDTDDDNNTKLDKDEIGSDANIPTNTDGKDLPDYQDMDDDNDGIVDFHKVDVNDGLGDSDSDGTPNYHDKDSDGDGTDDSVEKSIDTDKDSIPDFLDLESDGDGIFDSKENKADKDGDGKSDVTTSLTIPKTTRDVDGDKIENYIDLDSDGDGLPDDSSKKNGDQQPYIVNYSD